MERRVFDLQLMKIFVAAFDPTQNLDGFLNRRLVNHHGLKAAFERGIFFDIFAEFVQRGCADTLQFAA